MILTSLTVGCQPYIIPRRGTKGSLLWWPNAEFSPKVNGDWAFEGDVQLSPPCYIGCMRRGIFIPQLCQMWRGVVFKEIRIGILIRHATTHFDEAQYFFGAWNNEPNNAAIIVLRLIWRSWWYSDEKPKLWLTDRETEREEVSWPSITTSNSWLNFTGPCRHMSIVYFLEIGHTQ